MNIAERLLQTEQTFNTKSEERDKYLRLAEECLTEMTKLQGAFQMLKALEAEEPEPSVTIKEKKGK